MPPSIGLAVELYFSTTRIINVLGRGLLLLVGAFAVLPQQAAGTVYTWDGGGADNTAFNVGGTGEFTSANIDTLKALGMASGGFKSGSTLALDTTNASGGTARHVTPINTD